MFPTSFPLGEEQYERSSDVAEGDGDGMWAPGLALNAEKKMGQKVSNCARQG